MFSKVTKNILLCSLAMTISACSSLSLKKDKNQEQFSDQSISAKESLYESTRNYSALISLYRDVLKTREDEMIRYKLAEVYYAKGDSSSSLLYLEPLLTGQKQVNDFARTLQVKNLIQRAMYKDAVSVATAILNKSPKNGEIYNLRGIAYAQLGNLQNAEADINKARSFFINDVVAVNNLGMIYILNGDYRNAVQLLLPQYLNGIKEPRLVHNLVFALVKSNELDYAKDIIVKERLNSSPDDLINALKKTERASSAVRK
ncbi:nonspecific tight adherence protein D [Pasteurella multocida]|uniref:Tetratricopeptide repeat protein n=1 Tax=Pasteurella dagmatis ATCC 43325 TaxID=667128 RepID=C9PRL2_9PAST|nr:tetratricopeptide repeat protein [Pasteurella dagmatis]EEX49589.1 tetratricopeptide repeat protein [Pasteurella dagmatis ATCC 43325]SNV62765.1 nonspecific tight adherence protein D [Pasteurella dagmatis]VEI57438.1 nonspecific tight adherence protein D [Pasteurella multocida]